MCINNRDELITELKKQFLSHAYSSVAEFEDLEYFNSLSPGDQSRVRNTQHEELK